jgi:hypothetical protein
MWVALGFTLMKRKVFEVLKYPWFETGLEPFVAHSGSASNWQLKVRKRKDPWTYGGHDVALCAKAHIAGLTIRPVSDVRCTHVDMQIP